MITSTANPRIKHIRKLYDRKYRTAHSQFLIEGLRITAQAIEEGITLDYLIVSEALLISEFGWNLVDQQEQAGTEIVKVSPDIFKKISLKEGPQGIAAVGQQRWYDLSDIEPTATDLWAGLDRIQDPGNLGTILRTCDAVGGSGVILLENATDPYDPAALRASMGAAFSLKLVKSSFQELESWKKRTNTFLLGTSDRAELHYRDLPYPSRIVILLGSEREGLHPDLLRLCDEIVSIPMAGKNDSLNMAVAAGVIFYEYFEQNHRTGEVEGQA